MIGYIGIGPSRVPARHTPSPCAFYGVDGGIPGNWDLVECGSVEGQDGDEGQLGEGAAEEGASHDETQKGWWYHLEIDDDGKSAMVSYKAPKLCWLKKHQSLVILLGNET